MHPVVIIGDMLEIIENEQVLCSVKVWSITALTANILPVGNLEETSPKSLRVYAAGWGLTMIKLKN
jgi:hypothetical protein